MRPESQRFRDVAGADPFRSGQIGGGAGDPQHPVIGSRREAETFDIAAALLRMADGASGTVQVSRCAWGRKGRLQLQLFGARGAIVFDQERFNEVGLFVADGPDEAQGFKQVLQELP